MSFFQKHIRTHGLPLLLGLAFAFPGEAFAQNQSADSLARLLLKQPADTHRVTLLTDFAWEILYDEPTRAEKYLREALNLAQQLAFRQGEAGAWNALGVMEEIRDNLQTAIQHYQKSLAIRQQTGDQKGSASLFNNLGNAYESLGDYDNALENHLENLRIVEQLDDKLRIARAHYNIGVVHEEMGDYPEASNHVNEYRLYVEENNDHEGIVKAYNVLGNIRYELESWGEARKWYTLALKLATENNLTADIANAHNNLGNLLDGIDSTQAAIPHYLKAWEIRKGLEDRSGIAEIFNNLGNAHKHLKQYEQALDYLKQALKINQELGSRAGTMETLNTIGDVVYGQRKLDEALDYTKKYFALAQELKDHKFIQKGYKDFAKIHADKGDYKTALEYRIRYDETRYDRLDERRAKDFERKEALFTDRRRQLEIDRQQKEISLQDAQIARAQATRNILVGGAVALGLLTLLLFNRSRLRAKANRQLSAKNEAIERERERADKLLKNILPEATAEELKQFNKVKPERYESVTVLFTDFKSFTTVAEKLSPEELVAELDECFRLFDSIVEKHNLEKIKTIGDAYMCAGGLPIRNETHAFDAVAAGLEMQSGLKKLMENNIAEGRPIFEMRVGIHTGPVVAGVVGDKKFAYDIWGDAVNTAARMESGSEPGKVNISETTQALVREKFNCEFRGRIPAKNKGEIAMYFVDYQ